MINKKWNAFLFILKDHKSKELLEIAKNCNYEIELIEQDFRINSYILRILIDRISYKKFEEFIEEFTSIANKYLKGYFNENEYIKNVIVDIDYEPFVDWDAIRGIETKDSFIQKVKHEKEILLGLIRGEYLVKEGEYIDLHNHLIDCSKALGIKYPNKFIKYKDIENVYQQVAYGSGSWAKRRKYVNELYEETLQTLKDSIDEKSTFYNLYEPTGWAAIDRDIQLIESHYQRANSNIEYKAVANMLRDLLIKTAREIYQDDIHHPTSYSGKVSIDDFKRMIEGYICYKYTGDNGKEYRSLATKTMDVVSKLVHSSSTKKYNLTMCFDACLFTIRIIKLTEDNVE